MRISIWWFLKTGLAAALIAYVLAALLIRPLYPPLFIAPLFVGQALAILGGCIHLWHYAILKRSLTNLRSPQTLVTRGGLFARVRHPMYLGDSLLIAGFFLIESDWVALLIALSALISLTRLCKSEDRRLASLFPEEHKEWKKRTRRLIPLIW
jgi:protein-S-isoprenylcysteine O-methyltransferase Ste14